MFFDKLQAFTTYVFLHHIAARCCTWCRPFIDPKCCLTRKSQYIRWSFTPFSCGFVHTCHPSYWLHFHRWNVGHSCLVRQAAGAIVWKLEAMEREVTVQQKPKAKKGRDHSDPIRCESDCHLVLSHSPPKGIFSSVRVINVIRRNKIKWNGFPFFNTVIKSNYSPLKLKFFYF